MPNSKEKPTGFAKKVGNGSKSHWIIRLVQSSDASIRARGIVDEENARLDELEAEPDVVNAEIEEADDSVESLTTKAEALEAEYRGIEARSRVYSPDAMTSAGAFVFIGYDGNLEIARGYIRP
ncbi:MAG TPA: hypothetical protein VHU23_00745 [Rhizomicrobium sp.]|jgi:hypothetical protein|nr:hypothetical protein [Rhizomicrobium sp.]